MIIIIIAPIPRAIEQSFLFPWLFLQYSYATVPACFYLLLISIVLLILVFQPIWENSYDYPQKPSLCLLLCPRLTI
jgi:hypothetical protein